MTAETEIFHLCLIQRLHPLFSDESLSEYHYAIFSSERQRPSIFFSPCICLQDRFWDNNISLRKKANHPSIISFSINLNLAKPILILLYVTKCYGTGNLLTKQYNYAIEISHLKPKAWPTCRYRYVYTYILTYTCTCARTHTQSLTGKRNKKRVCKKEKGTKEELILEVRTI